MNQFQATEELVWSSCKCAQLGQASSKLHTNLVNLLEDQQGYGSSVLEMLAKLPTKHIALQGELSIALRARSRCQNH